MTRVDPGPSDFVRLSPGPELDPTVLKLYGARLSRGSWLYPGRAADVALLAGAGIPLEVDPGLQEAWTRQARLDNHLAKAEDLGRGADHPSWRRLDGHQRVGVGFLTSRPRALLAYSPGLGKSAVAVVAAEVLGLLPALVVAPLTLLPTWRYEIGAWGRGEPVANLRQEDSGPGWNLINPDQLTRRMPALRSAGYRSIIYDESVLYKSRRAGRTKAAGALAAGVPFVWLLSGSPVTRYADDLWAQLNVLRPEWFRSYWRFADQWTHVWESPWGKQISGNRDPAGLRVYLRDLMLTRTPTEVPVLPEARTEVVRVDLTKTQTRALEQARDTFEVNGIALPGVLAQLTRMAQVVSYPRILGIPDDGAKLGTLREMLQWAPRPMIVWCWFRETAEAVLRLLEKEKVAGAAAIHGGTAPAAREVALGAFQRGESEALVLQISTGKFGLSLTGARSAVFFDRSFGLDDWVQATARVRRRSSTASVPTYVLDGAWTDNLINLALRRKLRSVTDLGVSDLLSQMTK